MANRTHQPGPLDGEEVVRRLHSEHGSAMYGWALRRFSDPRDAEEVLAESLVKAWRHYDQFDPARGSERAWVFGILRNTAADHYRVARRHLRLVETSEHYEETEEADRAELVVEAALVHDALMDLSEQHREVIVEAFFSGRTVRQIAERIGVPPGTVKSRLFYGMRSLRASLEEKGVLA